MLSEQSLTAAGQHAENLWTEGSNMENVREILSLPEKYRIVGILSLGIPAGETKPHTLEEADFAKVHGWYAE